VGKVTKGVEKDHGGDGGLAGLIIFRPSKTRKTKNLKKRGKLALGGEFATENLKERKFGEVKVIRYAAFWDLIGFLERC